MKKINYKVCLLFLLSIFVGGVFFYFNYQPINVVNAQINSTPSQRVEFESQDEIVEYTPFDNTVENAVATTGTIYNNVFMYSLDNDGNKTTELNGDLLSGKNFYSGDLTSTLNDKFNTNDLSLKSYMSASSNEKLTFQSDIYKGTGNQILELSESMLYYQPYYVKKNGIWTKNSEGYFHYHLVESTSSIGSSVYYGYNYSYIKNYKLIANVYLDGTEGSAMDNYYKSVPQDTDASDKILSYSAAKALADSNSKYYLVESGARSLREFRLINEIYKAYSSSFNTTEKDTDGAQDYLDSTTFFLCLSDKDLKYNIVWSELLWAHKWNLSWLPNNTGCYNSGFQKNYPTYLGNLGYTKKEASIITDYLYNQGVSVGGLKVGTFNLVTDSSIGNSLYDLSIQFDYGSFVQNNATLCHELSHVLGLPDLYLGSGTTSPVGAWSHMCSSHNASYSFHTGYERAKLGWLDSTNIKKISKNGDYTLNAVKGYDGANIVGYYIENTDYPTQKFYLEYRNKDIQTTFDKNAGESGLLIYRVNTSYWGNHGASSVDDGNLEIYVCRKYNYDNGNGTTTTDSSPNYATFIEGESFGSLTSGKSANINDMAYMTSSKTYVSAGIKITVTEVTDQTLTFKIESNLLEEKEYTVDDFESEELYNKLKAQSDALGNEKLSYSSFISTNKLDVSGVGLTSTDFLDMFDISFIKYLNLANNNLNEMDLYEMYNFNRIPTIAEVIIVSANMIDLSSVINTLSTYNSTLISKINWGFQRTSTQNIYINQQLDIKYYIQSTDIFSIEIWNKTTGEYVKDLNSLSYNTVGTLSLTYPKNYIVKMLWEDNNVFGISDSLDFEFSMIQFSTKYYSESNALQILRDGDFPDINNLVLFTNYSSTEMEIVMDGTPSTKSQGTFNISVNLVEIDSRTVIGTIVVYYIVNDQPKPDVELPETPRNIEKNSTYEEYGVIVHESGTYIPYTHSNGGENKTYSYKYYIAIENNGEYSTGQQVDEIDTSKICSYIVVYTIVDSTGKTWEDIASLLVHINDILISEDEFDAIIYQKLLAISEKTQIFEDDFINIDYFDFSSLNLSSVKGLDKINYKDNAIINLSDNNYDDVSILNDLLNNKTQIAKLLLVKNNFNLTDKQNFHSTNQSKVIFGLQNGNYEFYLTNNNAVNISMLSDYSEYFDITQNSNISIETNNVAISGYGSNSIVFKLTSFNQKEYTFNVNIVRVISKTLSQPIYKRYNENFVYDESDLYEILGADESLFEVTNNSADVSLDKIGNKKVTFTIKLASSQQVITRFDVDVIVVDNIAPVLTINGQMIIYISDVSQLDKYYQDSYSAYDEYQGNVEVIVSKPNISGYGVYEINYQATDDSGNSDNKTRTIYYGNVTMDETSKVIAKNSPYELEFTFKVFEQKQFIITYKLNNSIYLPYDNSIDVTLIGDSTLEVKLIHTNNQDIEYKFTKILTVKDLTPPTITLKGQINFMLYAGQSWVDSGYIVTDDSVMGQFSDEFPSEYIKVFVNYIFINPNGSELELKSFSSDFEGTLKVVYTAVDSSENKSQKSRIINIVYAPVENVAIANVDEYMRYEQGENALFTAVASANFKTDPNVSVIWVMNGKRLEETSKTLEIEFTESGEYNLKAQVVNSFGDVIESQVIHITVFHTFEYTNVVLYVSLTLGGLCIVGFAWFFIHKFRNRYFY